MNKYFGGLFLVLSTLDMGMKQYIEDTFKKGEERSAGDSKLVLRKVHNKGFLLDMLDQYPILVKGASVGMGTLIAASDYQLFKKRGRWGKKLGMTILSAGAFSNIFDRLVRGYVVDYYGMKCKNSKLSKITANLADLYIFVGGAVVALNEGKHKKR